MGAPERPELPAGRFVDCNGGGRTYCDEIGGALRFGPCLDEPACDINGSAECDRHCELVDGVPTWIAHEPCDDSL